MLTVKVESANGETIQSAIREMVQFSQRCNVCAEQKINGVNVFTVPDSSPEDVYVNYISAVEHGFKVAS